MSMHGRGLVGDGRERYNNFSNTMPSATTMVFLSHGYPITTAPTKEGREEWYVD